MEKYMKNLTAARLNAVALQAECPHTMLQFAPATKHKRLAIRLGGEILQNPGMCSVFFWYDFLVQEHVWFLLWICTGLGELLD